MPTTVVSLVAIEGDDIGEAVAIEPLVDRLLLNDPIVVGVEHIEIIDCVTRVLADGVDELQPLLEALQIPMVIFSPF